MTETHRVVLNQILRQCTTPLLEGPFACLVNHTRVLDFDVKRRYFRGELERMDEGHRREELAVHVRRTQVFEDSFRELHRRTPDEWKNRFYIVFEGKFIYLVYNIQHFQNQLYPLSVKVYYNNSRLCILENVLNLIEKHAFIYK